jgi:hypothetical protein
VVPGIGLRHQHLLCVWCEAGAVVAKAEAPFLPIRVVGGHGARRVQQLAHVPQRERQAPSMNYAMSPHLARGKGVKLRTEEVDPEIPVRRDP